MSSTARIPTLIVTGFLGSGKTTLIKHLLETSLHGKRVALIENEIGEVSVDSVILKTQNVQISELTAGCMCCSISGEFQNAISDILKGVEPDVLLIETTGIANPISIFMMLANDRRLILEAILAVADAENLWLNAQENLVAEIQLSISDMVVLNKIDNCSESQLKAAENLVRQMNERAPIFKVVQGKIPPETLFIGTAKNLREDFEAFVAEQKRKYDAEIHRRLRQKETSVHHQHSHRHDESESYHLEVDEIETFAFELPNSFSQRKFEDFLSELPREVYRAKGVAQFAEMNSPAIFNFASGRYTIEFDTLHGETIPRSVFVFIGKRIGSLKRDLEAKLALCRA
ncbi:MAG: GTP-binding protein [Chloroherpetonaceae bacterium]|nr:GTP-binding protein [Chloroherpetonaceae bacterium]MDW8436706.1 GTP-binding protein [Chloroherpetonaceae bacterium]